MKLGRLAMDDGDMIRDGAVVMVGGFAGVGCPNHLVKKVRHCGARGLRLISNDGGLPGGELEMLLDSGAVDLWVCSHVGLSPKVKRLIRKIKTVFVPQGELAERIRAGGAGLDGIVIEGKVKKALQSHVSLVRAAFGDKYFNLHFKGVERNFNSLMAMAGRLTIAEVGAYIDCLPPAFVHVPGIYVNHVHSGKYS